MLAPAKSAEPWQSLIELRSQREIIERWLASSSLPDSLKPALYAMLDEVEDQIQLLTPSAIVCEASIRWPAAKHDCSW